MSQRFSLAMNHNTFTISLHTTYAAQPLENIQLKGGICGENYLAVYVKIPDQVLRGVQSDDSSLVDNGYSITQPLRFLHVVSGEKDSLSSVTYALNQVPHHPASVRIKTCS